MSRLTLENHAGIINIVENQAGCESFNFEVTQQGEIIVSTLTLEEIQNVAGRISDGIVRTPLLPAPSLSKLCDCEIFCKHELRQRTGSFKERGARNALFSLPDDVKQRGVIAASAGNHALALAYHGGQLGIPVTVVMPRFSPLTKQTNCAAFGADVVLEGETFDEAVALARRIEVDQKRTYIHGFDDPQIIAGQATLAIELDEQLDHFDAVIVPVGGGGLIAGVSAGLAAVRPDVEVIGVEAKRAASFSAALESNEPVSVDVQATLADGLAISTVGKNAFAIARQHVRRCVQVSEDEIALAVLRLIETECTVVEGAGAASLAALLSGQLSDLKGKRVILLLCGGNIDLPTIGRLIQRGLAADKRLIRFRAQISDRPGGLAAFAKAIGDTGANIVEINHDRVFCGADVSTVDVDCTVHTRDREHIREVFSHLETIGFPCQRCDV